MADPSKLQLTKVRVVSDDEWFQRFEKKWDGQVIYLGSGEFREGTSYKDIAVFMNGECVISQSAVDRHPEAICVVPGG